MNIHTHWCTGMFNYNTDTWSAGDWHSRSHPAPSAPQPSGLSKDVIKGANAPDTARCGAAGRGPRASRLGPPASLNGYLGDRRVLAIHRTPPYKLHRRLSHPSPSAAHPVPHRGHSSSLPGTRSAEHPHRVPLTCPPPLPRSGCAEETRRQQHGCRKGGSSSGKREHTRLSGCAEDAPHGLTPARSEALPEVALALPSRSSSSETGGGSTVSRLLWLFPSAGLPAPSLRSPPHTTPRS